MKVGGKFNFNSGTLLWRRDISLALGSFQSSADCFAWLNFLGETRASIISIVLTVHDCVHSENFIVSADSVCFVGDVDGL